MKLHELKKPEGSTKVGKRKGRGRATGNGTTAGRGTKGQNSRSGGGTRPGFEGGQMPLYRRLPKRGFTNKWRVDYVPVNVADLNIFEDGTVVTPEMMMDRRVAKGVSAGIKVLGNGDLTKKLTVQAQKFSRSAVEKIVAAGGKAEEV